MGDEAAEVLMGDEAAWPAATRAERRGGGGCRGGQQLRGRPEALVSQYHHATSV